MKTISRCLLLILFIIQSAAQGADLVYTFEDPANDSAGSGFLISTLAGDVIGGEVEINTDDGVCTVTWNATDSGFNVPMVFKLYLFNDHPLRTGMIELSAEWTDVSSTTSLTFTSIDGDFPEQPDVMDWEVDDPIRTSGYLEGVAKISGIYALDGYPFDQVIDSGHLEPAGLVDTDGDGIPDVDDHLIESDMRETVYLLDVNTWIPNSMETGPASAEGYTLADVIQLLEMAARADHRNHGQYVQELVRNYKLLVKDGLITERQRYTLVRIIVKNKT